MVFNLCGKRSTSFFYTSDDLKERTRARKLMKITCGVWRADGVAALLAAAQRCLLTKSINADKYHMKSNSFLKYVVMFFHLP